MSQPPGENDQPTDPSGYGPPGYGAPSHGPPGYGTPGYGPPGYGGAGYGTAGHPPEGQPPVAPYRFVPPPTHGQGLASMILGIVSLVLCFGYGIGLLGSPVAWWLGARSLKEIDAAPGQYSGRGFAQTGQILGIVGTVLLGLLLLAVLAILAIFVVVGLNDPGPPVPAPSQSF